MITEIQSGHYRLIVTKHNNRVLFVDNHVFAWVKPGGTGEILVKSRNIHKMAYILSEGRYRLFDVDDEPDLVDLQHLELEVGDRSWQGYILLTGLPDLRHKRGRILPTNELITPSSIYGYRRGVESDVSQIG